MTDTPATSAGRNAPMTSNGTLRRRTHSATGVPARLRTDAWLGPHREGSLLPARGRSAAAGAGGVGDPARKVAAVEHGLRGPPGDHLLRASRPSIRTAPSSTSRWTTTWRIAMKLYATVVAARVGAADGDRMAPAHHRASLLDASVPTPPISTHLRAGAGGPHPEHHGVRLRPVHPGDAGSGFDHRRRRWLVWAGQWWREDDTEAVRRMAKEAARDRYQQALEIPTSTNASASPGSPSGARTVTASRPCSPPPGRSHPSLMPATTGTRTPGCSVSPTASSTCARASSAREGLLTASRSTVTSPMTATRPVPAGSGSSLRCSVATSRSSTMSAAPSATASPVRPRSSVC